MSKMCRLIGRALAYGLVLCTLASPSEAANALTYVVHTPLDPVTHPPLIVLLHGSGADERDMIGLWSQLPRQFVVVSPRAPFADAAGGYRWYRKGAASGADMAVSRTTVDDLVNDAVKRFDADPKEIFLAGFSQGAVMVYDIALKEAGRFRGAAVLSGSLFASGHARVAAKTDGARLSFFVAHGTADQRIPFNAAVAARATLERLGVPIEFHAYAGMSHEIEATETQDLSRWLSERAATGRDAVPQ